MTCKSVVEQEIDYQNYVKRHILLPPENILEIFKASISNQTLIAAVYSIGLENIGDGAFTNFHNLKFCSFPNLKTVQCYGFMNCRQLKHFEAPKLEMIGT